MKGQLIERLRLPPGHARRIARARLRRRRQRRDTVLFLSRWLKAPHLVGALTPSGKHLARAMARQVDIGEARLVVELGGGTGSITAALLEAGLAPERLVVLERDAELYRLLRRRFPELRIIHGDAAQLVSLLRGIGIARVSAIVSSLPLLSLPRGLRQRIIDQSFALLGEHGRFVQFTYSIASPIPGGHHGVEGKLAARVWRNFPPAAVWRFHRRKSRAARVA